jgi:Holliday junction resolvase RusA-like endonuclease
MSLALHFTVAGVPRPKERARKGKGGHWYTPARTAQFEQTVAAYALQAMAKSGWIRGCTDPVTLTVHITPATKGRPDIDNCLKAVADALNGLVYADDVQVVEAHVYRLEPNAAAPQVHVSVCRRPIVSGEENRP